MTTQELIQEIQRQNPLISQQQIIAKLEVERARTNGLLCDETLLRLIAAKFGVQVNQNNFHNDDVLSINRLVPRLNNVTVAGRLIAVFPVKSFQSVEKTGKFATLMIADNEGILRVVAWDERVELVEKGELKANQVVKLMHGYTKEDRCGKTELHLGKKSQIQIESPDKAVNYPDIKKFISKIASLKGSSGNVLVIGTVKSILAKNNFARTNASNGLVLRLILMDDSGQITVVAWNEKAEELQSIQANARLQIVNARIKEAQNSDLELHVDSNSSIQVLEYSSTEDGSSS